MIGRIQLSTESDRQQTGRVNAELPTVRLRGRLHPGHPSLNTRQGMIDSMRCDRFQSEHTCMTNDSGSAAKLQALGSGLPMGAWLHSDSAWRSDRDMPAIRRAVWAAVPFERMMKGCDVNRGTVTLPAPVTVPTGTATTGE